MTALDVLTIAIPSAAVGVFIGVWIAYDSTPRPPRSGISLDSRLLGFDTWRVTYQGCANRGGPCGAIDSVRYPAPMICPHGGIKAKINVREAAGPNPRAPSC